MSRGAVLLRAARQGKELEYAPVEGASRHGPRAPGIAQRRTRAVLVAASATPEVVVLVGLPGAGKSTFYRQRFADSHALVSKDLLPGGARPARRQGELIAAALRSGRSVVVDNTNATRAERVAIAQQARRLGARVRVYFFDCPTGDCLARNAAREGRARIPPIGIFAIAKRLQHPTADEGFDQMFVVAPGPALTFDVRPLRQR
jgi:predicted kinase